MKTVAAVYLALLVVGPSAVLPPAEAPVARSAVVPPAKVPVVADAAMRGDIAGIRRLIAQHADVNAAQGDGMTALHWAAERGDSGMTVALLRARAKPNGVTRIGGYTPLHIAAKAGSAPVVKALLAAGSDANTATVDGATALHFAAASGSVAAVTALLDHHANVNAREPVWDQTPLIFAATANRPAVIQLLLKRGADAAIRTKTVDLSEQAAQEQAATKRRNEVLISFLPPAQRDSILAANKAAAGTPPVPVKNVDGTLNVTPDKNPQAPGTAPGTTAPVATLPVATPTAATPTVATPTAGANQQGGGRGEAPPVPTDKLTPAQIQEAILEGRKALVTKADRGAVEADTSDGQVAGYAATVGGMGGLTALHHAVRQGNLDAVVALLDGGADINEVSATDSTTPLLLATINGQFDVALRLVERGAKVNLASTAGATPLYTTINTQWAPRSRFPQPQAVQNQRTPYLQLMDALLKAGADPNVRIKHHLWYFAYNNCGNANCGLENLEGSSAFWRAAYAVDVDAMRLLKAHGADATIPSLRAPQAARGGGRGRGASAAAGTAAGAAGATGDSAAARAGGGGGGGDRGQAPSPPLDPATDSAAKAVPPGVGVYPIHAAAGVGYGNGFAGNSHRHAPDGWMPAMKYLVEELGADVNQRDANGFTPLHHAAARGDNEMILYLVSKGADVKAVSRKGQTTVDMANGPVQRVRPFPETIALLEKLGAKNSHRCVSC